jgi:hypothetical protein
LHQEIEAPPHRVVLREEPAQLAEVGVEPRELLRYVRAIGQERDAINHPGKESFDGEIARFLMWDRPLDDAELAKTLATLRLAYGSKGN